MLLAFVAGTMNLAFMGGAMVLMTLENFPTSARNLPCRSAFSSFWPDWSFWFCRYYQ